MKAYTALAASALIVATTMDSATAMKSYLEEIPNGSSFTQDLGHPDKDSSQFTKFGTAFGAADHTWTAEFCKATFPGASMTNGEAFGDPCCTWKKGGTPDFTVTAFTTTPGKATVCASGGGGGGSAAETPSTETQGSGTETESSGAATPSAETPSTETESSGTTDSSSTSQITPPASGTGGSSTGGGWGAPPATGGGGCGVRRARKFRH
ncbi:hypothetical protein PI124_g16394 [Phytophthora idaei]|nr:hypothetical protein PI125_g11047 [Phytophthora idaei]KAG3238648.1 hypothetical protein PI124_g16394 [Phytophthora idaei]